MIPSYGNTESDTQEISDHHDFLQLTAIPFIFHPRRVCIWWGRGKVRRTNLPYSPPFEERTDLESFDLYHSRY